eukprot:2416789-Rhodomonas_salina.1
MKQIYTLPHTSQDHTRTRNHTLISERAVPVETKEQEHAESVESEEEEVESDERAEDEVES